VYSAWISDKFVQDPAMTIGARANLRIATQATQPRLNQPRIFCNDIYIYIYHRKWIILQVK